MITKIVNEIRKVIINGDWNGQWTTRQALINLAEFSHVHGLDEWLGGPTGPLLTLHMRHGKELTITGNVQHWVGILPPPEDPQDRA